MYCSILLAAVLLWVQLQEGVPLNVVYITSTSLCPHKDQCMNLSRYLSFSIHTNNTELIFLPGDHQLSGQLTFKRSTNITLSGAPDGSSKILRSSNKGSIVFDTVNNCHIRDLSFSESSTGLIRTLSFTNSQNISILHSKFLSRNGKGYNITQGALFVENCKNVTISNTHFIGANGGAVFIVGSHVQILSSYFVNNTASGYGGALAIRYSQVTVQSSCFVRNVASNGGAISAVNGTLIVKESNFFSNQASKHGASAFRISKANVANNGGAIVAIYGKLDIEESNFVSNRASKYGASVFIIISKATDFHSTTISHSQFSNGIALSGAAVTSLGGNTLIYNSKFTSNSASLSGGALYFVLGTLSIMDSVIEQNCALEGNGSLQVTTYGGGMYTEGCNVTIMKSQFSRNYAQGFGGAVYAGIGSMLTAWGSHFELNYNLITHLNDLSYGGGALSLAGKSNALFNCTFSGNTAQNGGAIYHYFADLVTIHSCVFVRNTGLMYGGAVSTCKLCFTFMDNSSFISNKARIGGAIYAEGSRIISNSLLHFENNSCDHLAVVYLHFCNVSFNGGLISVNNIGSLFSFVTDLTFKNTAMFINNTEPIHDRSNEGGALTFIMSNVILYGHSVLRHNQARHGGGIFISKSTLFVPTETFTEISNNTAYDSGGAVYSFQSRLLLGGKMHMVDNRALQKGGGVMATGGTVEITAKPKLLLHNQAKHGGGMYLKENSMLLIKKFNPQAISYNFLQFSENVADFGGALFVEDDSNSGVCSNTPALNGLAECFLQILRGYSTSELTTPPVLQSVYFSNNTARIRGNSLYGGLFDRCTLSIFNELRIVYPNITFDNAFSVLNITTHLDTVGPVTSDPVRVCFCSNNTINCSTEHAVIHVRKGHVFKLSAAAVDQVHAPLTGNILASTSRLAGFKEGQTNQTTLGVCTELEYNIYSPNSVEELIVYADGPCMNMGQSQRKIIISFDPCTCFLGFQASNSNHTCECVCDQRLNPFITNCSSSNETLFKQSDFWLSFSNETNISGFIIYEFCPYDYCKSTLDGAVPVDLNTQMGTDQQCAFNRSGRLCGACLNGFSITFGSSRCAKCTNSYLALLILFALAGIVLVIFLLICNLTVATGSINGLIFYANMVIANRSVFLPAGMPKFLAVFISWINLDLGIETCFYDGMDMYAKTLLQLVFPTYVLSLVVILIVVSEHNRRFATLIGKRNPVATLATLILLSYAKFLRIIITSLSFSHLQLPDGSREMIWLPDANVQFLAREHIPRFIIASVIILVSIIFIVLLLFEKCFRRCSRWKLMKCFNNTKLHAFMDAYYAPYKPQHCYWVGLLLLVRATLYLHAVGFNSEPTLRQKATLLAIIAMVFLLFLFKQWKVRIHKNWILDFLETSFLVNLGIYSAGTYHILSTKARPGNQLIIACISLSTAFCTFLVICVYHIYAFVITPKSRLVRFCKNFLVKCLKNPRERDFHLCSSFNEAMGDTPYIALQPESEKQIEQEEDNVLREPALDILAPITESDWQKQAEVLPSSTVPVTYSVIGKMSPKE